MTGLLMIISGSTHLLGWANDDEEEDKKTTEKKNGKVTEHSHEKLDQFYAFRRKYIVVYLVIMLADWMQGTHMYTLYLSYGVNISALFLTGFLSGAIFAPFLGSLVDKFGRKRSCIVYCLLEIVINILEHFHSFPILIFGRILGGISTNLLFSAFESWMTTEHRRKGFPEEWLSRTYSVCSIGNGSMAIFAGIVAQVLEDSLGQIGPFQGAVALTALALVLVLGWEENYGEEHVGEHNTSSGHKFFDGWKTTMSDSRVLRIGLTQALSEGAMYTWVFTWVPSLLTLNPPGGVPTGCVFSSLMMAVTIGGILFSPFQHFVKSYLAPSKSSSSELLASLIYLLAAFATAAPVICMSSSELQSEHPTFCLNLIIASFLVFEFCVGLFMPVAGTLRSKYVPDALQGAILNIFRLPLNAIVVSGTYATDHLEASLVYKLISACLFGAAVLQATLMVQPKPQVSVTKKSE